MAEISHPTVDRERAKELKNLPHQSRIWRLGMNEEENKDNIVVCTWELPNVAQDLYQPGTTRTAAQPFSNAQLTFTRKAMTTSKALLLKKVTSYCQERIAEIVASRLEEDGVTDDMACVNHAKTVVRRVWFYPDGPKRRKITRKTLCWLKNVMDGYLKRAPDQIAYCSGLKSSSVMWLYHHAQQNLERNDLIKVRDRPRSARTEIFESTWPSVGNENTSFTVESPSNVKLSRDFPVPSTQ